MGGRWRKAVLLAAALTPFWGGVALACSLPMPTPQQAAAWRQLGAVKSREVPCPLVTPLRAERRCVLYLAPPGRVLPLLAASWQATPVRWGSGWRLSDPTPNVHHLAGPHLGGTLTVTHRQISVRDKLASELHPLLYERLSPWEEQNRWRFWARPGCAELGLIDNAWYAVRHCRVSGRGSAAEITLTLGRAADASLPVGQRLRYGRSANTCSWYDFL